MKKLKGQLGLSLVEISVVLAITGLIVVPLTAIFRSQLVIPEKIAGEVVATRQIQKSTLLLIEDAQAAQEFTPGTDPEYGTFSWVELAGPEPIPVTARYFFKPGEGAAPGCDVNQQTEPGTVLRQLTRSGDSVPPIVILESILVFCEVEFLVEDPIWDFDSETRSWTYTEGQVTVIINRQLEAGAAAREGTLFGEQIFVQKLIADFRPQGIRPVAPPPPG